jgi:AcrR family transcriptional regulator
MTLHYQTKGTDSMPKKRAISEEQKQQRRRDIIQSAWHLFACNPYEKVTMINVAANINVTKGTLYLYFPTKEALFLAIFSEEIDAVFNDINRGLEISKQNPTIKQFVELLRGILQNHPTFIRLTSILHIVLENNVDYQLIYDFKTLIRDQTLKAGSRLEESLSFLEPLEGAQVFLRIHEMIIGCQHVSDPGPVVAKVLDQPGFEVFQIDFATELLENVTNMLYGVKSRKGGSYE